MYCSSHFHLSPVLCFCCVVFCLLGPLYCSFASRFFFFCFILNFCIIKHLHLSVHELTMHLLKTNFFRCWFLIILEFHASTKKFIRFVAHYQFRKIYNEYVNAFWSHFHHVAFFFLIINEHCHICLRSN